MRRLRVALIFLGLVSIGNTIANVSKCSENIAPVKPLILVWPGLPSGGIEQELKTEIVSLRFLLLPTDEVAEITVISSTSKVYNRAARRTTLNTKFSHVNTKCLKVIDLKYEQPRT